MNNPEHLRPHRFSLTRKSDAIGYFSFTDSLFRRFPAPPVALATGSELDLRGVFFHKQNAYVSNNHFAGRARVADNFPLDDQVTFYSFADEMIRYDPNFLSNGRLGKPGLLTGYSVQTLDQMFDRHARNTVFIHRQKLLDCLHELPRRIYPSCTVSVATVANRLQIGINSGQVNITHDFPPSPVPGRLNTMFTENNQFSVNMMCFEQILENGFFFCDIIGLRFDGDSASPVTIFNNSRKHQKTAWVLAQTVNRRR